MQCERYTKEANKLGVSIQEYSLKIGSPCYICENQSTSVTIRGGVLVALCPECKRFLKNVNSEPSARNVYRYVTNTIR